MINIDTSLDVGVELAKAWQKNAYSRLAILIAAALLILAILLAGIAQFQAVDNAVVEGIAAGLGVLAGLILMAVVAVERAVLSVKQSERLEKAEQKVAEHPEEVQAAWELAQVKLEAYLNRNLKQVRSIYWLTVAVMTIGFILVGVGVVYVYSGRENLPAAVLSTISGILINFIGGSFLLIYRSTMEQARDYVLVLERINAVGMAVQILDTMDGGDGELKRRTTAEIAKEMLSMYAPNPPKTT
ncbi:MAG: hypothetical protein R3C18_21815 [Planctomycetaceae bacterium]